MRMRFSGQLSAAVIVRGPSSVSKNVSQLNPTPELPRQVTAQLAWSKSSVYSTSTR